VVNKPASYSGCPRFKISARRPATLNEVFMVFPNPSRQILEESPKIRPRPLAPTFFSILIHLSSFLRRYTVSFTEKASLNKLQKYLLIFFYFSDSSSETVSFHNFSIRFKMSCFTCHSYSKRQFWIIIS
jgi:hypothetical protein